MRPSNTPKLGDILRLRFFFVISRNPLARHNPGIAYLDTLPRLHETDTLDVQEPRDLLGCQRSSPWQYRIRNCPDSVSIF